MSDVIQPRILSEVYFMVDCEMDGPCPGLNSLLSLGAIAFNLGQGILGEFSINLEALEGAAQDRETMEFWNEFPNQYAASRVNPETPRNAMWQFALFIDEHTNGEPVFTSWPGGGDFVFTYWYFHQFLGFSPFRWLAHDVKSYAQATLKLPFRDTRRSKMPDRWKAKSRGVEHLALDDSREQAEFTINLMCEHLGLPNPLHKQIIASQ